MRSPENGDEIGSSDSKKISTSYFVRHAWRSFVRSPRTRENIRESPITILLPANEISHQCLRQVMPRVSDQKNSSNYAGWSPRTKNHRGSRWEVWHRILGPFPKSYRDNKRIVVATEYFTRFAVVKALPDATTPLIAMFIVKNIVCTFGCSEEILSDRGSQFRSKMMHELTELL